MGRYPCLSFTRSHACLGITQFYLNLSVRIINPKEREREREREKERERERELTVGTYREKLRESFDIKFH